MFCCPSMLMQIHDVATFSFSELLKKHFCNIFKLTGEFNSFRSQNLPKITFLI